MALDIERIRAGFPHLARGVYLNTASAGLSWAGEGLAAAEFYDGKSSGMGGASEWRARVVAARSELGSLLGVPADSIQFVGSATEALNLLALSFPLNPGDKVVLADDEFPSVIQSWIAQQSRGARLVQVPIHTEAERTKTLCEAIVPGVRALAVSHVHWRTGTRVDLDQLRARCREHDCRLIVDGVQAVGAVPVQAAVADAYCASVFKWLLSGFGLGFVTVGESLAGELQPVIRGYNNEPPSRSLGYGHINYPGIYTLQASLEHLRSFGWDNIHAQVAGLAAHTIKGLRARGFEVITPGDACAGIVSIPHPQAATVVRALAEQSIFVEDRGALVRASPHFYNTTAEIDLFVAALARIA